MSNDQGAQAWMEMIESEKSQIRHQDLYPRLKTWITGTKAQNVLEIGCGQGACSSQFEAPLRYTGVDFSPLLIKRARELYSDKIFLEGSATQLPLKDSTFDGIFSVSVWHLIDDIGGAAQEMKRVLKEGGDFFIVSAHPDGYEAWKEIYETFTFDGRRLVGQLLKADGTLVEETLYLHSLEDLKGALESSTLSIQKIDRFRSFITIQGQAT
jgi:ubiquinone/menaquinone biosynthesis C-methylase UbiE